MAAMPAARPVRHILQSAAPIAIAVLVFGISFGVLAVAAHLPGWSVVLMSILVFAGSAQFAALAGDRAPVQRDGPVSRGRACAAPGDWHPAPAHRRSSAGEPGRPDRRTLLVVGATLYAVWVLGTLSGTLLGPVLGDPKRLGLDAAFPALFLALLWPMLSGRHAMRCALGGAAVALLLAPFTPPGIPLAGAAVVGLWLAR